METINKISIVIPTWNSMPEIKNCFEGIRRAFPRETLHEIIIVDKFSTDGTVEFLRSIKDLKIVILFDGISLGNARLKGIRRARTKWICFLDSDIELPVNWFHKMCFLLNDDIGWIYGRTIDDCQPLMTEKLYKMDLELGAGGRFLHKGERAYTNNTICLRKPLLNAKISHLNAWEDYILTQCMLNAGYKVKEVPITCKHLRKHTYNKFGVMTEAWNIAGELKAKGANIKTLLRPFWFLYWGLRCWAVFKEFEHFRFNFRIFLSMWKAIVNRRKYFEWNRSKN